jgi:hypothetical protein
MMISNSTPSEGKVDQSSILVKVTLDSDAYTCVYDRQHLPTSRTKVGLQVCRLVSQL